MVVPAAKCHEAVDPAVGREKSLRSLLTVGVHDGQTAERPSNGAEQLGQVGMGAAIIAERCSEAPRKAERKDAFAGRGREMRA